LSEHFLENLLSRLDNDTEHAMNQLNGKIFDKFNTSIDNINIASDISRLTQLSNVTNSTDIKEKVQQIIDDLRTIQTQFDKITNFVSTLPTNLVNQTTNDVSIRKQKQ
jgi:molecular chaperone GrpE (heat shock protein)